MSVMALRKNLILRRPRKRPSRRTHSAAPAAHRTRSPRQQIATKRSRLRGSLRPFARSLHRLTDYPAGTIDAARRILLRVVGVGGRPTHAVKDRTAISHPSRGGLAILCWHDGDRGAAGRQL